VGLTDLLEIVAKVEQSAIKGEKIEGVSSDRSQTILAGSIVLVETMRSLGAPEITVCTAALREGVVVDRFLQTGWLDGGLEVHRDPRSDSVHTLLDKYRANVPHAEQVAKLAEEIFRQTQGLLHDYPYEAGHLLWSAAMLHDVGTFIGRNGHHKHSYYLIRHGGLLGHSEDEVELIAWIARYHRGSEPKESHVPFNTLRAQDKKLVSDLAAILRVAEALDRSHRQVVDRLRVTLTESKDRFVGRELVLEIFVKQGETCQAETWALEEKKEFFERQYDLNVVLLLGSIELSPAL
jgi:exopolyphosphatase / guanosine-5'-triphosphate,3'-diphosphate pyrophosphatase